MRAALVCLVFAYVLSQFYRAFLAVLSPLLTADIGATPEDLAAASGLWFLAFSLMQIPVGSALDRVGPRITTQPGEVPPGAASGTAAGNAPGAQSAPAPAAPLSATSAAPAPAPAGAAPAAPPGGQPVTDPKLLEDLQRAITAPPAGGKPPARPATQPTRPQPQSKP